LLAFLNTSVNLSGFITLENFLLAMLLLSSEEMLLHGMSSINAVFDRIHCYSV